MMKYIVTETENKQKEIFLFPTSVNHDAMAEVLNVIKNQTHGHWHRVRRNPVSAGFVENGLCFGSSETLGLKSAESDSDLLGNSVVKYGK